MEVLHPRMSRLLVHDRQTILCGLCTVHRVRNKSANQTRDDTGGRGYAFEVRHACEKFQQLNVVGGRWVWAVCFAFRHARQLLAAVEPPQPCRPPAREYSPAEEKHHIAAGKSAFLIRAFLFMNCNRPFFAKTGSGQPHARSTRRLCGKKGGQFLSHQTPGTEEPGQSSGLVLEDLSAELNRFFAQLLPP